MKSFTIKKSSARPFFSNRKSFVLFIVLIAALKTSAQEKDTLIITQSKDYKNTVKVNVTSWILYHGGVQVNYERILSKKRSFTVFGGIIQFPVPSVIANSSLVFNNDKKKSGFSIGADYRFYLASENKYNAPRGVYLAPFVSYYHFNNQRTGRDSLNPANSLLLNTTVDFFNVGVELGYQFVIKNRFVIDCVLLGPGLSSYHFNIKLDGSSGNYNEQVQAILDALKAKFPLLKDVSSDEGVSKNGISNFWSVGFRYCINIGYRF
jgi:Protein of unknown function (DUF3575)